MARPSNPRQPRPQSLRGAHGFWLVVRFLLELALLAAVVAAALRLLDSPLDVVVAVLAPLAVAVIWGVALSPRATVALNPVAKVALEAVLFGGVAVLLASTALGALGIALVSIWVIDRVALRMTR